MRLLSAKRHLSFKSALVALLALLITPVILSGAQRAQSKDPGGAKRASEAQTVSTTNPELTLTGELRGTHDPAIAEDHGHYYVFATGLATTERPAPGTDRATLPQLPMRCSDDLKAWHRCGAVFPSIPDWIRQKSPTTSTLWAPDISYFHGEFHLYYTWSIFGKNTSGIALATSPTLDPATAHWTDRGPILESHAGDDFNAIDPNVLVDEHGTPWLTFGSFWTGIKLRRLDAATGQLSTTDTKTYSLATRAPGGTKAIEAPFLFAHEGFYYLFVSWDICCKGAQSTYREMVGRAAKITGPYLDRDGKLMFDGGGTPVLTATTTYAGPGGASLVHTNTGDYIAFHAYALTDGASALHIAQITWKDGWPTIEAP